MESCLYLSHHHLHCLLLLLHLPPSANGASTSQRTHLNVLSLWDDSIFNKFDKHRFMTTKYFLFKNLKIINWVSHGRYLKAKLLKIIVLKTGPVTESEKLPVHIGPVVERRLNR